MLPMVIEEINLQKWCSQINIFSERQFLHKFEKSMDLIPLFFFNLSKVNININKMQIPTSHGPIIIKYRFNLIQLCFKFKNLTGMKRCSKNEIVVILALSHLTMSISIILMLDCIFAYDINMVST